MGDFTAVWTDVMQETSRSTSEEEERGREIFTFTFSHLADAFIQSDLQMRTTEAINCSIKTTKTKIRIIIIKLR